MKEAKTKAKSRAKFFVDRDGALVHAAVIFMALAAVFRLVGCWGLWSEASFAVLQIALPVLCALLFIVCLQLFGKRALWTTVLPVILGVVFFIARALGFESLAYTLGAILACILIAAAYTATVFGFVRTKWLVLPLIALLFLYKLCIVDAAALKNTAAPVSFAAGMQEISVLCALLSLFSTALAMKNRRNIEDMDLPKIKAPKVIIKSKAPAEAATAEQTAVAASAPENAADKPAEEAAAPSACTAPADSSPAVDAAVPVTDAFTVNAGQGRADEESTAE